SRNYTPRGEQIKAGWFAIRGAEIKQVKPDCRKKDVWCPCGDPSRNPVAFAQRKKKMDEEVHREHENHCRSNTRQNAATRVPDSKRHRDTHHDQAGPRQSQPVLEMSAKRSQQCGGKIRIEMQVFPQFWEAQEFGLHVRTAQPERSFAPVVDRQRGPKLFLGDVSTCIVVSEPHVF